MKKAIVEFNDEELKVIGMALGDLPFRVAAPLVYKIEAAVQKAKKSEEEKSSESQQTAPEVENQKAAPGPASGQRSNTRSRK